MYSNKQHLIDRGNDGTLYDLCPQKEHLLDTNDMPEREIETMHIACPSQNNRHHLRQSDKSQLTYLFLQCYHRCCFYQGVP